MFKPATCVTHARPFDETGARRFVLVGNPLQRFRNVTKTRRLTAGSFCLRAALVRTRTTTIPS